MFKRGCWRRWRAGFVLSALLGCSSSHTENPPPDPEFVAAARAERERIAAERQAEAAARAEQERAVLAIESETDSAPRLLREDEVYLVLAYYCVECHVEPANTEATDGFWDLDDMDAMIEGGRVIPGDGEGSRLIRRMRAGEMPPMMSGAPQVPAATVDRLADYIDSLAFPVGPPDGGSSE
jgi:hypothetical protein